MRGAASIGMVFQEPKSALNPLMSIGDQVAEPYGCMSPSPRPRRGASHAKRSTGSV